MLARKFRYLLHHFEHVRGTPIQYFQILAADVFNNCVCQPQNVLQPFEKSEHHVVVFLLFLQELDCQALPLILIRQ